MSTIERQKKQADNLSEAGNFDSDHLDEIMDEEKPNQREKVTFKLEDLIPFFPEAAYVRISLIIRISRSRKAAISAVPTALSRI